MDKAASTTIGPIGRRIDSALAAIVSRKWEDALIHLFPAMDKTAKRRRPKASVSERIRAFIDEQQVIITAIAFGNILGRDCSFNGLTFSQAIYKFGRTSIAHEGQLDERLRITAGGGVRIGQVWELPSSTVMAMCIAVIIAPENARERSASRGTLTVMGENFEVQELWGAQRKIEDTIRRQYRRDVFAGV